MKLSLSGGWKVSHVEYSEDIRKILEETFIPEGWLDAEIPEEIHSTLRKAGIICGNTYNKTEDAELWIEEKDWVYYKEFFAPISLKEEKTFLKFEGLDTFCEIYLNGISIGHADNMHIPHTFDIKKAVKFDARNVLIVRFFSPTKYVLDMDARNIFSITTSDRILARKAQMNYSWDFCARCVTTGIWKNAEIISVSGSQIGSYYLYTKSIDNSGAVLSLQIDPKIMENDDLSAYTLLVSIKNEGEAVFEEEGKFDDFTNLKIDIKNPKLWWPRPYGEQNLYEFSIILKKENKVTDMKKQKFGIRTVEIIRENQGDGQSFIFQVNGRRLFIRGANWVPINTVYTDITDADYEDLIDYASSGNISMLRIWGGGIYESKKMFELCDEKGIMLWSDFMFSCGIYPQNDEFLKNVAREAEFVVKEYRNYTSLVIWTGDNENGQAYGWAGRTYEFENDKVSNVVIKDACKRLDPNRFYMPTSPCSPDEFYKGGDNPQSPYQGDMHLYIMSADPGICSNRDYGKNYYKRITGYKPRFMSEFGFIGFPEKDTFYRFNFLKEKIRHKEELVEFLPLANEYIENIDHNNTIYFSQVFNSMALKYWIEYFRSLKWTCSGSLYWKFNDPKADSPKVGIFPSHMATVDMYRKPKMTYYYTKRAYDNMIIVCVETALGYNIFACNEELKDFKGKLIATRRDFAGNILEVQEFISTAKGDSSTFLCQIEAVPQNKFNEYLKIEFITESETFENRYLFADICEINKLELHRANLVIAHSEINSTKIKLILKTNYYARNIRLNILDKRADYSDNYFEMDANSEKTVTIKLHDKSELKNTAIYIEGENIDRIVLPLYKI